MDSKYKRLMSNTVLFALSSFSSKLLGIILQPYITFAMGEVDEVGITKLVQQIGLLLIPLVSMGVSFAIIRFGLERSNDKRQVFTNGFFTIWAGFALMIVCYPLLQLIPLFSEYALLLYLHVLMSCMRTLCTQFVRSRQLNRLVAVDGVLCSAANLGFMILFLSGFHMGAQGYVLAVICSDALSSLFVFVVADLQRYLRLKSFSLPMWKKMMAYALPMVPAQISFWVISASNLFFVQILCEGYGGNTGEYWAGLLSVGSFLPTILTVMGTIFYEAWQLSAVTEEQGRGAFFSKVFGLYQTLLFCCCSGIILLCRPLMFLFKENFYNAWQFVPLLTLGALFNCFNQFLSSVYMVEKRSTLSLTTMLPGAVLNCVVSMAMLPFFGPIAAGFASMVSYLLVFVLRIVTTRKLLPMRFKFGWMSFNLLLIGLECVLMQMEVPGWPVWCTMITAVVCLAGLKDLLTTARQMLRRRRRA
ncbi:lipopolysaccharide biosynthesis protein [uncultured Allofournierella sp.]|uniref:lipopolysaccharide biosynthesis protein n=1 Tax=uncultured Allofournierella sp. TaxID=1940258 RepID=UPI003751F76C